MMPMTVCRLASQYSQQSRCRQGSTKTDQKIKTKWLPKEYAIIACLLIYLEGHQVKI